MRATVPLPYVFLGGVTMVALWFWQPVAHHLVFFGAGMLASLAVASGHLRAVAVSSVGSTLALVCIVSATVIFPTAYSLGPILMLSVAFILIACGSDLFGLLSSVSVRLLGDMAYSVYLLHGLLLFVTFRFVVGLNAAGSMSPLSHWATVLAVTPMLVLICWLTFRYVEQPCMLRGAKPD